LGRRIKFSAALDWHSAQPTLSALPSFRVGRTPACVADKSANRKQIFMALCLASFVERDVVFEFQTCAFLPFKRPQTSVGFSNWTAQKHPAHRRAPPEAYPTPARPLAGQGRLMITPNAPR